MKKFEEKKLLKKQFKKFNKTHNTCQKATEH